MEGHIQDKDRMASVGVGKPEGRSRNSGATNAEATRVDPARGGQGDSTGQKTTGEAAKGGLAGTSEIGIAEEGGEGGTNHPVEEAASSGQDAENADVELSKLPPMRIPRRPRASS